MAGCSESGGGGVSDARTEAAFLDDLFTPAPVEILGSTSRPVPKLNIVRDGATAGRV